MAFNTTILFINQEVSPDGRITKILFLMIIEVLAIIGNILFLSTVFCQLSFRNQSRTYIYFCYVSMTSLTTAIFVVPFPIVSMVTKKWSLGPELCYFNGFMTTFCLTSCVYSITVLSLHKYMSVVLPMKRQFSTNQTYCHCAISLIISLVITVIPFIESRVYFNPYTGLCGLYFMKRKAFYTLFVVVACYAFPTFVNILIYIQIFRALRKHGRRLQFNTFYNRASVSAQRQTVNTMYMTFGSYMLGWSPFFVYAILYLNGTVKVDSSFLVVAYLFGFANSVANPFIFIFRNMKIKNSWSSVFRRKQIPKVQLVSTVSRFGFSSDPPSPYKADNNNIGHENRSASFQNDYVEFGKTSLPESNTSDYDGNNGFLRTTTNVFNYANPADKVITFKTKETEF